MDSPRILLTKIRLRNYIKLIIVLLDFDFTILLGELVISLVQGNRFCKLETVSWHVWYGTIRFEVNKEFNVQVEMKLQETQQEDWLSRLQFVMNIPNIYNHGLISYCCFYQKWSTESLLVNKQYTHPSELHL